MALKEKDERNSIELKQLKLTQNNLEDRLHYLEYREAELTRWINALLSSVSWKITAPLRAVANFKNWVALRNHDVKDAYKKGGILNIVSHTSSYFSTSLFGANPAKHPILQHNSTIVQLPNDSPSKNPQLLDSNIVSQAVSQVISSQFDVVCFANIEWSARYQRPQHLMSQFAKNGYRVFYIIASRRPPANVAYMIDEVAENIYEICLHVGSVQNFYDEIIEHNNQLDFLNSLAELIKDYRIKTAISVVHLPYWTPLALELRSRYGWKILYDCMDEWIDFPNIGKALIEQEEILVRQSDLVTVTASLLYDKWSPVARHCILIRNAVDYVFFRKHCSPNPLLDDIARPIIGYYGALAEWVDFELLSFLAEARPNWSFVLIGDIFVDDIAGLEKMQNIFMLGRRPYTDMPRFLYHFDVCLIPFKLNNVTHAVDPVKFYEFVSAGKPIVSVPLKELKIYGDYIYFADQPEDFLKQLETALVENNFDSFNKRIELAQQNDWSNRFDKILSSINELYKKASFIIVTYNNCNLTQLCVESIFRNTTYPNYEVILVDNASSDDTRNYLRYLARTSDRIKIILNDQNLGFAKANNQGLKVATGELLVLLNNDTVVPRGWLDPLLKHLENPDIGLVGPVTNFVGNEAKIDIDYQSLDEMEFFADRYTDAHTGKAFDIAVLAMFCVAMRRNVFENIGFLDEKFGIGMFEDDDYSNRIREKGLRVVCAEDAFVHHFGQAAFKKLIETGEYQKIWANNQAYYEEKWGKWKPHTHRG
ncbi:MAG: glycosyltransferase [Candidatus Competibacter sp.]|nr:glycosyltransferase [Candidatus Competibacter sp.]